MHAIRYLLLALALSACCASARADGLPLIVEHYDAMVVVSNDDVQTVYFVRDGKVFASRYVHEEMILHLDGGLFCLSWQDYFTANRAIYSPTIWFARQEDWDDGPKPDNDQPWWAQNRSMRELKQPRRKRRLA